MSRLIVAPSILSADFSNLEWEIEKMVLSGAEFIHFDVMDGAFVPNKTFDCEVVAEAPEHISYIKDVHLMVVNPDDYIERFVKAGADIITFHYEATSGVEECRKIIEHIHSMGIEAGISIKPMTSPDVLFPLLGDLDLVLVMSVEPGKGGQSFMEGALDKIAFLRKALDDYNSDAYLEVDGGINDKTGRNCADFGADVLVAGSYLYGHDDYAARIKGLLEE